MADEGVRTLYAPRESTTVWRKADEPETTVVATRKQLDPSGTALVVPTRDYASTSGVLDPPRYAQSGMVQVQIVKHNGAYVPLVDGLIPPHEVVDGETIHLINHHRGMYEDEETQTWVFSPCAVSVCIEDGQALPERCAVAVWQRVAERGATRLTGHNEVKLGERELRAFRVSDTTASVVYAPYPSFYSRPPRIIVNDMTAVILARERGAKGALYNFLSDYGPLMMILKGSAIAGASIPSLKTLVNFVAGAFQFGTLWPDLKTDPETGGQSTFETFSAWLRGTTAEALKDSTTRPDWKAMTPADSAGLFAGIIGFFAMISGMPGSQVASNIFSKALGREMTRADAGGRNTWAEAGQALMAGAVQGTLDPATLLTAGIAGVSTMLNSRAQPKPVKRYFTLGELATVIESLSAIMPLAEPELKKTMTNEKFASEAVVLQWLLAAEPGEAFVSNEPYALKRVGNRVDLSEFDISEASGIQTDIYVELEDNESTEACAGRPKLRFQFSSTRVDKAFLGHAMAGVLYDLRRLQEAIHAFDDRLASAAKAENLDYMSKLGYAWTWLDYWFFDPIFASVKAQYKGMRSQTDSSEGQVEMEINKMLGKQRRVVLNYVRKNLQKKLHTRFTTPHSEGDTLVAKLQKALDDRFLGIASATSLITTPPVYTRELPQKVQQPVFFFPPSADADSNYVDVQSDTGTMREFSPLHDAAKVGVRAARAASSAIVQAHRTWETTGPRCLFVHAYSDGIGDWAVHVNAHALRNHRESYSLVLQLPGDIRAAEASTRLDEESERRILTLCHKGAAAAQAGTLLAHSKLPDTEAALVAMSLFAELWTDELLKLHALPESTSRVVSVVETAQVRAARRCTACGAFLEAVTVQAWSGLVPLSESATADPALLATQAGRDAARLARRLQLVAQPVTVRGVLSKSIVRRMRAIGATLVATGNRLAAKPDTDVLPSEPLQSLFMKPVHGLHAYARATSLPNLDARVAAAIAAAYPSSLLLSDIALDVAVNGLVRTDAEPQRPPLQVDAARIVQRRMAALRFDYPDTVHLDGATKALHASDKALVEAMSSLSLASGARALAFYVPYGYGQAPPRLVYPPVPAPMFGSVPVWTEDVLASIDALSTALGAPGRTGAALTTVSICPVFPCGGAPQWPLPEHPSLLDVRIGAARRSPKDVLFGVDVCFWASEPELGNVASQPDTHTPTYANEAANKHLQGTYERKLASRVSTLAWNAERILQSLLLLAGGGVVDDTTAYAQLVLSDGDARVAVPVRAEPDDVIKARLEYELKEAKSVAQRDANWHFAELRRAMRAIEAYIEVSVAIGPPRLRRSASAPNLRPSDAAPPPLRRASSVSSSASSLGVSTGMVDNADLAQCAIPGDVASEDLGHAVAAGPTTGMTPQQAQAVLQLWWGLQYLAPAIFTLTNLTLATGTVGTSMVLYKGKRHLQRVSAARNAEELQLDLRMYITAATSSDDTKASTGCELPFLRYTTRTWNDWTSADSPDAKRAVLKKNADENGQPLSTNHFLGMGNTFAKGLKQELERLRDPNIGYIEDLINGVKCPTTDTLEPWELWVLNGNTIAKRAFDVFLDADVSMWRLHPTEEAQNQDQAYDSTRQAGAVPNPSTVVREAAYESIKTIYGDNPADYASSVNVVYYQNRAVLSFLNYKKKQVQLKEHAVASATRAEQSEQVRRHVRMHTLAAGVVGNALARGVLGDDAPQLRTLAGPDALQLVGTDYTRVQQTLSALRLVFDPETGTSSPTAYRLGELCAIVQSALMDTIVV
jgi:hypothetical protein